MTGNCNLEHVLQQYFGYATFRPNQEEIVRAILSRQDVFAVMPTGGGKSLCFQLPACIIPGTCIVISPLISLMKDQVDGAIANGLRAAYLNSSQTPEEMSSVFYKLKNNMLDLLYVSPERFALNHFIEVLKEVPICLFAIDEAHCISEWGHDFRPDYLALSTIRETFPGIPIAAFTASATPKVQQDIVSKLNLHQPHLVLASFDRHNLFYQVESKYDVKKQILDFVKKYPNDSGIVYRTTRKDVEETAKYLENHDVKCHPYHAGMANEQRQKHQEAFNNDDVQVIVATIAFGMGIDKSNVRFIVHGEMSKHIEGYYQETGRAGRDGEPAFCLLLFSRGDMAKFYYFIDQIEDDIERNNAISKLRAMSNYASSSVCRRVQLLKYFGETYKKNNCQTCDICVSNIEPVDCTVDAQKIMSAMARTNQKFGIGHIIDIVSGANTKRIKQFGHDTLKTYGVGENKTKKHWRMIVDELLGRECIFQTKDSHPIIKLTQKGLEVLHGRESFTILQKIETKAAKRVFDSFEQYDHTLFEILRKLRMELSKRDHIPPYAVFSDKTLHEMCTYYPTSKTKMLLISGVGQAKVHKYGPRFMNEISKYLEMNPDITPTYKQKNKRSKSIFR